MNKKIFALFLVMFLVLATGAGAQTGKGEEYAGLHIMQDGSVMLGDGTVLEDATVNEDGMVEINGQVITPVMDMRSPDASDKDHMELMEGHMEGEMDMEDDKMMEEDSHMEGEESEDGSNLLPIIIIVLILLLGVFFGSKFMGGGDAPTSSGEEN